jgi:hypothetical protein
VRIENFKGALLLALMIETPLVPAMPLSQISPTPITYAAADTVTIDFATTYGAPTYRASGFIYGLSEDGTQPAQNLQSDIKTRFIRAGGAQLDCPNGGYVNGQYARRWNSVKGYYARTQAIGAKFILLTHDLWGADAVCNVPRWPGDNGDWTEFTNFMTQVINDAKANGMTGSDVQWDIWNEPDLNIFWGRSQSQYLEMWKRAYQQIRAAIPDAVIVGPSTTGQPSHSWIWFTTYLDYVKANNVVPDYISWHQLVAYSDPQISKNFLDEMLSSRDISVQGYEVNEYGAPTEQMAGPSAWYIGRFERAGIDALRANWGMGGNLYKGMGGLVTSSDQPMASWWTYKRYADMTGMQVAVTAGRYVDGVAATDSGAKNASILLGSRAGVIGEVTVQLNNIPSYLQNSGKTRVVVEQMPEGTSYVSAPTVVSDQDVTVSNNSLTLTVNWSSAFDAYSITLTPTQTTTATTTPSEVWTWVAVGIGIIIVIAIVALILMQRK